MKMKFSLLALTFSACTFLTSHLYAQEQLPVVTQDATVAEQVKSQDQLDEERMAEAKSDRKATKAKARDAHRVEADAKSAARESKNAHKAEKKAQRSRKKADKQAKSAEKARDKSNQN